jgi:hypothetical protein
MKCFRFNSCQSWIWFKCDWWKWFTIWKTSWSKSFNIPWNQDWLKWRPCKCFPFNSRQSWIWFKCDWWTWCTIWKTFWSKNFNISWNQNWLKWWISNISTSIRVKREFDSNTINLSDPGSFPKPNWSVSRFQFRQIIESGIQARRISVLFTVQCVTVLIESPITTTRCS